MALFIPLLLLAGCVDLRSDGSAPAEEDLQAAAVNILTEAPKPQLPVNANLQDHLEVIGCDIKPPVGERGKSVEVTTYFRVLKSPPPGWRLFFHADGPAGRPHVNHDHAPLGGKYPVTVWKPGQILRDIYRVSIPKPWPVSTMELFTGLWRGKERYRVISGPTDGANRVRLATLEIAPDGAASAATLNRYEAYRIAGNKEKSAEAIRIDGVLDEAVWQNAVPSSPFVQSVTGETSPLKSTFRALYDDKFLYLAFENEDKDIWSTLKGHDGKLWSEEVVEAMIDPDGDGKSYIELQVNPLGATFDAYLPTYRKNENQFETGFTAAVKVDGTLDKRDDEDRGWNVEMKVPWTAFKVAAPAGAGDDKSELGRMPKDGSRYRINFFRIETPKPGSQGRPLGLAWSPPLVPDFHQLARFGEIVFAGVKASAPGQGPEHGKDKATGKATESAKKGKARSAGKDKDSAASKQVAP